MYCGKVIHYSRLSVCVKFQEIVGSMHNVSLFEMRHADREPFDYQQGPEKFLKK